MTAATLKSELDELSYDRRFRRLVELGRESRSDHRLAAIFAQWEVGSWQERQMAVQSCQGSRDADRLVRLSTDRSRTVAGLAQMILADIGTDGQIVEALLALPRPRRHALLNRLRTRQRLDLVDSFLDGLAARGDSAFGALLPFGSAAVARHLEFAQGTGGRVFWQRLAKHHPPLAAERIVARLDAIDQPDGLVLQNARIVARQLSTENPDLALRVVQAFVAHAPLAGLALDPLVRRRPGQVADVVLAANEAVSLSFARVARRLDRDRLFALLDRQPLTLADRVEWLPDVPPEVRRDVYTRFGLAWRDGDGCVDVVTLRFLPTAPRVEEARRHLALPALATRPASLIPHFGLLPWDEARERLTAFINHPEPELRIIAWPALCDAARFDRARLGDLLQLVVERKNEQDPVRASYLTGLAGLPPTRWGVEHLPELGRVIRAALDATDLSWLSVSGLASLIFGLVPVHPDWALEQLSVLFRERGVQYGISLESRLTVEQAQRVESALLPVYRGWRKGNRAEWLLTTAQLLGRRLRDCPTLLDELKALLGREDGYLDHTATELLRRHRPRAAFGELVESLLDQNIAWATVGPIFTHLHRRRQELLPPVLSRPKIRVKNGTIELVSLLPVGGFRRYTDAQQAMLATTLVGQMKLSRRSQLPLDVWRVLLAAQRLAALPAADPARLVELASDKRPLIYEMALRALGKLDADQGLPVLVEALGDDRGRIAIYATRRAMVGLPGPRVMELLRDAPRTKVTVAKEVVRLVGDFGGPAGFDWLRDRTAENLHRDVRIAVLRALWEHLERPEAWDLLRSAATNDDERVLTNIIRIPADRLSVPAIGHLTELMLKLTGHPSPTVRTAILRRLGDLPIPDPTRRLLDSALDSLGSRLPDERSAAALAVLGSATPADAERLAAATARLLPKRRPAADWLTAFATAASESRRRLGPAASRVVDALTKDRLTAGWQLALAAAAGGAASLGEVVRRLDADGLVHSDALWAAAAALGSCSSRPKGDGLDELEPTLRRSDSPRLRRVGLAALVASAAGPRGWTDERRSALTGYQSDADDWVASAAQFTFVPDE